MTGKLSTFNFISLNGFTEGPGKGDISWHRHGSQENDYAASRLALGATLLFGRITYQMMASYWPTLVALDSDPVVAKGMNEAKKVVFSTTLDEPGWQNVRLVKGDAVRAVTEMKQAGTNMTILGSGTLVTALAAARLIDEFALLVDPIALGGGTPLFDGMKETLALELLEARPFPSGAVLLRYGPKRS
jgi:dihydrofolate reductase